MLSDRRETQNTYHMIQFICGSRTEKKSNGEKYFFKEMIAAWGNWLENMRKLLEDMNVCFNEAVVKWGCGYIFVKKHQIVFSISVHFTICKLNFTKNIKL